MSKTVTTTRITYQYLRNKSKAELMDLVMMQCDNDERRTDLLRECRDRLKATELGPHELETGRAFLFEKISAELGEGA